MSGRQNDSRRQPDLITSRDRDHGRVNQQHAPRHLSRGRRNQQETARDLGSQQHNQQRARDLDGRRNGRSASPSRTPRNRDDERSYRDREEPLPRIATWEEYESARELLYQCIDKLTLEDSIQTRYWEARNNRLLNHLEEAKRYLPNRHRPRNDPALPTAPVRSHEERDLLRKQCLQAHYLEDYYERNNDREQAEYWRASALQLLVRYKAGKTTLPPRNLPAPPAPVPPAPISDWNEYNSVRDNALKLCTAALSLKDLDAPAAASYLRRARRLYERLEPAERHLPPRNPAEIKAESVLTNTPASLSAVISHTAALLQPDASNHSTAERARQQGSAV